MAQDDEPTLLLAHGVVQEEQTHPQIQAPPLAPHPTILPSGSDNGQLHLVENQVYAAFDDSGGQDPKR